MSLSISIRIPKNSRCVCFRCRAELEGRFDLRFTLDTMEDFTLLQELYATFHEKTDRSVHALLQLVQSHPDYRARMLENIARNEK